jgi:hypothetical protein
MSVRRGTNSTRRRGDKRRDETRLVIVPRSDRIGGLDRFVEFEMDLRGSGQIEKLRGVSRQFAPKESALQHDSAA